MGRQQVGFYGAQLAGPANRRLRHEFLTIVKMDLLIVGDLHAMMSIDLVEDVCRRLMRQGLDLGAGALCVGGLERVAVDLDGDGLGDHCYAPGATLR